MSLLLSILRVLPLFILFILLFDAVLLIMFGVSRRPNGNKHKPVITCPAPKYKSKYEEEQAVLRKLRQIKDLANKDDTLSRRKALALLSKLDLPDIPSNT